ncbi:MAG: hypothetical protein LUO89_11070 [Methanothrix sp.]|nr:hypothetical protein [Methanothrix sp.]
MLFHLILLAISEDVESFLPIEDLFITLTNGLAAAAMLRAAHCTVGRSKNAWTVIAAAMVFITLGNISWAVIEVVFHQDPFPSVADVSYIIAYLLFALGVFLLPDVPFTPHEKVKILLDAAIVIISAAFVFWELIIAPIVGSAKVISLELMVSLAYPIMVFLLLSALIEILFRKLDSREQGPIIFLALGTTMLMITEAIFSIQIQQGTFTTGRLLDVGWVIGYVLMGLAGIMQINTPSLNRARASGFVQSRRANWTLNLPLLGICLMFLLIIWGQKSPYIIKDYTTVATFGILIGLMFFRQKISFDENNRLLAMTLSEIEERKRVEEDLRMAKEKAESATKAKTEFLANMSHEIRTPMNAIIGMTGILMDENLVARQREYVEIIRNSGDTLLAIINNILDLSKIDAEMIELESQPFDLRDCLKISQDMVAADAKRKGLDVRCIFDEDVPIAVLGDPTRINQILIIF